MKTGEFYKSIKNTIEDSLYIRLLMLVLLEALEDPCI